MRRVGLVLTGGEARRMGGRAKHELRHPGGETLLFRIRRALAGVTDEVWVVGEGGPSSRRLEDPRSGPALAVSSAARRFSGAWLVVTPGDLVRPSPKLLRRLAAPLPDVDLVTVGSSRRWAQLLLGVAADFAAARSTPGFGEWFALARCRRWPPAALTSAERAGLLDADTPRQARHHRIG